MSLLTINLLWVHESSFTFPIMSHICSHWSLGERRRFLNIVFFFCNVAWKSKCSAFWVFAAVNVLWSIRDKSSWLSAKWAVTDCALLQETQMSRSNSFPLHDYGIFSLPGICKACLSLHKQLSTLLFPKPPTPLTFELNSPAKKENNSERSKRLLKVWFTLSLWTFLIMHSTYTK